MLACSPGAATPVPDDFAWPTAATHIKHTPRLGSIEATNCPRALPHNQLAMGWAGLML
ncbi:unannotated protein [freshwater metagenome]|uniref:Unannotated protein n=1 Tax=freshwater metagenome TaxID=449393 RepID=A0A6J6P1H4_9ZZZZ